MPVVEQQKSRAQHSHLVSPAKPDWAMPQVAHTEPQLLARHRAVGNQAMQRMLRSRTIQAKLAINEPGDQYEQEADRVADAVMRMPDPCATEEATVSGQAQGVRIQRMCTECEEELPRQPLEEEGAVLGQIQTPRIQRLCSECEEELHRQPMEEDAEETLQAKEAPGRTPGVVPGAQARVNALRSGGQPLPESVRAFFEPRFGHDFSQVRVHTNARAAESARAVNALAYTVGRDIVFGAGQHAPWSPEGGRLLAHELMHVLQQTEEPSSSVRPLNIGSFKDVSERGTDAVARQVIVENGSQPVASSKSTFTRITQRVQRQAIFSSECRDFHRCKLQDSLGHAKQMVDAVLAELPRIAQGAVTAGRIIDLLKVHFHTASANNATTILDNFRRIGSELTAPIRYICHSDVPPECEGPAGGFTDCGASGSDVHLCAPYFVIFTCEQRARALVHEAAHHVPGFLCRNETYLGDPGYATLPPEQAMRNPDTYAQFARLVFRSALNCRDCAAETQRRGSR